MSVWVTGDIHGDPIRLSMSAFPEQKRLTKEDYVIILGDFGVIWDYKGPNGAEKYWLDWLEEKSFTTLFIDGNHENFERLNQFPVRSWHGGTVHVIRDSVLHLMRGQIFELDGSSFFTLGGARSHDIQDGVLDPEKDKETIRVWSRDHSKLFRVDRRSWWKEEMPTEEEMKDAWEKLRKNNMSVDYILTHECPASLKSHLDVSPDSDPLSLFLDRIREECSYRYWIFGHYHVDRKVTSKDIVLYEQIVKLV